MQKKAVSSYSVLRYDDGKLSREPDLLVEEEPLEIRLRYGPDSDRKEKSLSVTMRTPGNDFELALGFLFTEGIIPEKNAVRSMRYCLQVKSEEEQGNVLIAELVPELGWEPSKVERHFYAASSCGICGKASIELIHTQCSRVSEGPGLTLDILLSLPDRLMQSQTVFKATGGLHASGIANPKGELFFLREDVGRHNAVDKVVGAALAADSSLLKQSVLVLSGRAGFEIVQKAAVAGIPAIAAVGAPSSLALQTAKEFGITLIGFIRNKKLNIYHDENRIQY